MKNLIMGVIYTVIVAGALARFAGVYDKDEVKNNDTVIEAVQEENKVDEQATTVAPVIDNTKAVKTAAENVPMLTPAGNIPQSQEPSSNENVFDDGVIKVFDDYEKTTIQLMSRGFYIRSLIFK